MASPVQLSDLPVATVADDNDTMLIRKSLTDYQIAVLAIRQINIGGFSPIPAGFANPTDLLMISRSNVNYNIRFNQIGFIKGTRMWFWQLNAPSGWSIIADTGDRLLGVSDGTHQYSATAAGSFGGDWQQTDTVLNIQQIPAHTHTALFGTHAGDGLIGFCATDSSSLRTGNNKTCSTGGQGSTRSSSTNPPNFSNPATLGHNHGNTWRPLANIGIICNKDG